MLTTGLLSVLDAVALTVSWYGRWRIACKSLEPRDCSDSSSGTSPESPSTGARNAAD